MISGRTHLYGVVGHPVGHSLSPAMHNAAFRALGLDAAYVALPVVPERLAEALRGAHALGFRGLNVTVPHKQRAAELCGRLDAVAALCGAANTLRRSGDGWEGSNTDAPACLALLQAAGVAPGARALLLGAGGAALAGAWALLSAGAAVEVTARRPDAGAALAARMRGAFPGGAIQPLPWEVAVERAARADVIVNATTIGLGGASDGLPPFRFRKGQVAADFVYGETAFARAAQAEGATVVTGEQILVRQGALAFTLWTGHPAPEAVMTAALRAPPHTS
ncbi:MAG: shikimate dehydrogenase family protein [Anaeromyxobacteraceae bacterium]